MGTTDIPGDPGGLHTLASQLTSAGENVGSIAARVAANGLPDWIGAGANVFRDSLNRFPTEMDGAAQALGTASTHVSSFASELEGFQYTAAHLTEQIAENAAAQSTARERQAQARFALDRANFAHSLATDPVSLHTARALVTTAEAGVSVAGNAFAQVVEDGATLAARAAANFAAYQRAVQVCIAGLGDAVPGIVTFLSGGLARAETLAGHVDGVVAAGWRAGAAVANQRSRDEEEILLALLGVRSSAILHSLVGGHGSPARLETAASAFGHIGRLGASGAAAASVFIGWRASGHGTSHGVSGEYSAEVGADASADAHGKVGRTGASGSLGAAAFVGGRAKASAEVGGKLIGADGDASAMDGAEASGHVDGKISATEIEASGGGEAFAGAKAEAGGSVHISGVEASGHAGVSVGIGAEAQGSAKISLSEIKISGKVGVTLGIGGDVGGSIDIKPGQIASDGLHVGEHVVSSAVHVGEDGIKDVGDLFSHL